MSISNTEKKAFTLAETIMTLVIVGLVVTASIPIFTEKTFGPKALNDDKRVWRSCTTTNLGLCTTKPVAVNVDNPETTGEPYSFYANTDDFLITDSFNPIIYKIGAFYFVTKDKNIFFSTNPTPAVFSTNNVIIGYNNTISTMISHRNVIVGNTNIINTSKLIDSVIVGSNNTLSANPNSGLVVIGKGNMVATGNSTTIGNALTADTGESLRIGNFLNIKDEVVELFHKKSASDPDTIFILSGTTNATKLIASDLRLKNLHGKYEKSLDEVTQLNPVEFYYNKDEIKHKQIGLIAQDVQKIFPEAVVNDSDGYFMLDTMPVFYAMFNAIKELDEKTKIQKQHNEELKQEINKIKVEMGLTEAPRETLFDKFLNFFKRIFGIK